MSEFEKLVNAVCNEMWSNALYMESEDAARITLLSRITELEKERDDAIRKNNTDDFMAAIKGIPVFVNKYLPKNTIYISADIAAKAGFCNLETKHFTENKSKE